MVKSVSKYLSHIQKLIPILIASCFLTFFGCMRNTNVDKKRVHDVSGAALQENPLMQNRALATNSHFVADLSGVHVKPNPVRTDANGKVYFRLSQDQKKIFYTVYLMRADSVTMIHVHEFNGQPIGPELVWLYPKAQSPKLTPGPIDGEFVTGTITPANLIGPLKGHSLMDFVNLMKADSVYVIVHTTMHPKGQLRGKVSTNVEQWKPNN